MDFEDDELEVISERSVTLFVFLQEHVRRLE